MSYSDGEALILTQIQAATNFDATNTSRGKWGILNKGVSDHYVILKPGPFIIEGETLTQKINRWRTVIEVWQRYKDDGTSMTDLEGYVEDIFDRINQYRKIGDSAGVVQDANITGGSEVTEQWRDRADGPSWLKQELYLDWWEEDDITYAE